MVDTLLGSKKVCSDADDAADDVIALYLKVFASLLLIPTPSTFVIIL